MHARFPGRCSCGARFLRGEVVTYNAATKSIVACPKCNAALKTPSLSEFYAVMEAQAVSLAGPNTIGALVWVKHPNGDLRRCKIVDVQYNGPAADYFAAKHNRVVVACIDTGWSMRFPEIDLMAS